MNTHSLDTLLANWKSVLDSNCVSTEQAKRIAKEAYTLALEAVGKEIKELHEYNKKSEKIGEWEYRYLERRGYERALVDLSEALSSLNPPKH